MLQALVQFHEHRGRHKATKSVASIVEVMPFNVQPFVMASKILANRGQMIFLICALLLR